MWVLDDMVQPQAYKGPSQSSSKALGLQLACLSGSEAQAELLHQGVDLLLLGNEGEQVAHDGLEVLRGQAGLAGQAGQHVRQQVVDGACTLKEKERKGLIFSAITTGGSQGSSPELLVPCTTILSPPKDDNSNHGELMIYHYSM